jgi:hypothetical protein
VRDFYLGNLKDLETVISPYRGPLGKLEGAFTADPEILNKTMETERLSLSEPWEGNLKGGFLYRGS